MSTTQKSLRVLIVDDNSDGADALGLLVEALGNQVHVTYGGTNALEVATAFRPDLMLVDLVMPGMDGCGLVKRLRQMAAFAQTKIVAFTGQKDKAQISAAMQCGFDDVLNKPAALSEIKAVLANVVVSDEGQAPHRSRQDVSRRTEHRLPIEEARRIRSERLSKALTQAETEAAICDGIIRYQQEYLGWKSDQVHAHLIKDLLVVRIRGVLTLSERQLSKSPAPENGRTLIKRGRMQLLELARPMLESLVHEVAGVKVVSMHHDISTVTGEEIVVFSLTGMPRFE